MTASRSVNTMIPYCDRQNTSKISGGGNKAISIITCNIEMRQLKVKMEFQHVRKVKAQIRLRMRSLIRAFALRQHIEEDFTSKRLGSDF